MFTAQTAHLDHDAGCDGAARSSGADWPNLAEMCHKNRKAVSGTDLMALLEVEDLAVRFKTLRGEVHAVNGVDLAIDSGETVALVGESGCGKSVTALAILGLLGRSASVTRGHVCYDGRDLIRSPESELRKLRGASVSMIFQDPMTSLNPVMTVGAQIREILEVHTSLGGGDVRRRAVELLDEVGIPDAARRAEQYPHQFSGGMRQRA